MEKTLNDKKISQTFREKAFSLLEYIYLQGGKDYEVISLVSSSDYSLAGPVDEQEFKRIIQHLKDEFLIKIGCQIEISTGVFQFKDLTLTDKGIAEVEKVRPKIPMISLVVQEIITGDANSDEKINYARNLFFQEPQTTYRMRSACETLSFALEPLRDNLKKYFLVKDTKDFFQLVNSFDIRHNKDETKSIEHPEQLEWVFYSLLNTINTYTKLKKRLGQ